MPRLVPSYVHDGGPHSYHALIYVCDAAGWRGGEDETMTRLEFEPLSREDHEKFSRTPRTRVGRTSSRRRRPCPRPSATAARGTAGRPAGSRRPWGR